VLLKWRREQKIKVLKGHLCCWAWSDAFEVLMMSGTEAITRVLFLAGVCISGVCSVSQAQIVPSSAGPLRVETFPRGLDHPWAIAFLPDGRLLVTERPGRMRIVSKDGKVLPPLAGVPRVFASGQGGLLDVALDRAFAQNQTLYFCYAEPTGGGARTAVARARLVDDGHLDGTSVIFHQEGPLSTSNHFGCRIAQAPDDNPFVSNAAGKPEIWTYGHRSPQGLAFHPSTGRLWEHEHGPRGGDEINIIEKGKNYGWPVIGYGVDYSGARIHESTHKQGMEQPIWHWTPSIAPSGMSFYTGNLFANWHGNLFIGALAGQMLVRLELDGEKVSKEEHLLQQLHERIRDVRQGPDGALWLSTDSGSGCILRLTPK
jgi:glucose/arabinose dehydrogenase